MLELFCCPESGAAHARLGEFGVWGEVGAQVASGARAEAGAETGGLSGVVTGVDFEAGVEVGVGDGLVVGAAAKTEHLDLQVEVQLAAERRIEAESAIEYDTDFEAHSCCEAEAQVAAEVGFEAWAPTATGKVPEDATVTAEELGEVVAILGESPEAGPEAQGYCEAEVAAQAGPPA